MATVTFHGDLKRFAGQPFELEAGSFAELMSGLLTQIQGLREHLRTGRYKVRLGKKYLSEQQIKSNPQMLLNEDSSVHFTPVIAGAGKGLGVFQIIAGVALIALAWWNPLGWSAAAVMMAGATGASLALSGAMTLLTPTPSMDSKVQDSGKKQSTSFSNIRNLTPQGRPVPLLYGEMLTSLILISQGVETFDDVEELEKLAKETNAKRNRGKGFFKQYGD